MNVVNVINYGKMVSKCIPLDGWSQLGPVFAKLYANYYMVVVG